jgi:hypothetical protein
VHGKRQDGPEQGGHQQEGFGWTVGNEKRAHKSNRCTEKDEGGRAKPPPAQASTAVVAA